jgi:hypothetical protein
LRACCKRSSQLPSNLLQPCNWHYIFLLFLSSITSFLITSTKCVCGMKLQGLIRQFGHVALNYAQWS